MGLEFEVNDHFVMKHVILDISHCNYIQWLLSSKYQFDIQYTLP